MAQKNKVKELVGRGLHSYHTKALQQMDRIEKKNKEQNHKISILSNELDNDYLTKTEEGSVISLEHSKEGMVYLDELQGNTLVNYCTDGSKELTLNGDIDVEGTFVTTTEGVDNGKVDVMCEGNTLVNLYKSSIPRFSRSDVVNNNANTYNIITNNNYIKVVGENLQTSNYRYIYFDIAKLAMLKPNTKYTIIFKKCKVPSLTKCTIQRGDSLSNISNNISLPNGSDRLVLTTRDTVTVDSQGLYIWNFANDTSLDIEIELAGIIEGDYANKEIPSKYFEGMKSVGQDDTNGHKIEILSRNSLNEIVGNGVIGDLLINQDGSVANGGSADNYFSSDIFEEIEPNTQYYFWHSKDGVIQNDGQFIYFYDENRRLINGRQSPCTQFVSYSNAKYFKMMVHRGSFTNIKFFVSKQNVKPTTIDSKTKSNKKEILMNEPLRGLPNGLKDRIVKIGSKWFIERNISKVVLNGTYSKNIRLKLIQTTYGDGSERKTIKGTIEISDFKNLQWGHSHDCLSYTMNDKYLSYRNMVEANEKDEEFCNTWDCRCVVIQINKSKLSSVDETGFNSYLQNNPVEVIYQLETPIYEPLEIEPTLNCYNDITYISNNSIIPCNMKIKNSGYNAIIKPSTLYTVALDTNKSGTIGMNLGGMKTVTTNNVATITTPAILSDDSLRLFGKGIKGSKVRLLEGDKTNWIPSHFEGMKSSFEDKLQDDGSYKMEILSNDMSLFDIHERNFYMGNGASNLKITQRKIEYDADANYRYLYYDRFDFVKGKKYTIAIKGNNSRVLYHNNNNLQATGITSNNIKYVTFVAGHNAHTRGIENGERGACKVVIEDVWIYEGEYDESKHTTTESNKIQFSSIEPLRKWDKFVFKNGQLMIERGSKVFVLDGNTNGIGYTRGFDGAKDTDTNMLFSMRASKEVLPIAGKDGGCSSGICNILPNIYTVDVSTKDVPIGFSLRPYHSQNNYYINIRMNKNRMISNDINGIKDWLNKNNLIVEFPIIEPTYEEIPFELQKIILEGYENGTLFFDTNIPPTSTVTYAGETPIVKATKLNKTEVLNNTEDINDNIIPYLMDMDYRVVMLQLATEEIEGGVSMARLFGGAYEMLKRDILSKRLSRQEYGYRLADYFNAGKLTEEQVRELEDLR